MFEKYTEKAINVVGQSQVIAVSLNAKKMMPEHLLLALIQEAKGISLKIFKSYDITYEKIEESLNITNNDNSNVTSLSFDEDYKTILKNILDLAEK